MIPIVLTSPTDEIDSRVREAVQALGQPVAHFVEERKAYHPEPEKNRVINIARGRTEALKMALKHKRAKHFLFIDADIVPPADIFERFDEVADDEKVIGAWWRTRFGGMYVGGWWDDGIVKMFGTVQRRARLTETHFLSLGCTLVPRRYLVEEDGEAHLFSPGIDRFVRDRAGKLFHIADSGAFSRHVARLGGRMFLDAAVIAQHISENQKITY